MNPEPSEQELLELLNADPVSTSPAHDAAVLAAARTFVAEPRPIAHSESPRPAVVTAFRARKALRPLLAAAAAAALAILVLPRTPAPPDQEVLRGEAFSKTLPANGATLKQVPMQFIWPAVAGANAYRLTLRDATASIVWKSPPLLTNQTTLDASTRQSLTPQTYYWTVTVEGNPAAPALGPFWFQIEGE